MAHYTLPSHLRSSLDERIAVHIEKYAPSSQTMSCKDWEDVRAAACDLAAVSGAVSPVDAQQTLTVICRFLHWTQTHLGSQDIATVFTEHNVARFLHHLQGELAAGSRNAYRGRLRQCLKALAGKDPRTRHGDRPIRQHPYSPAELERLNKAARRYPRLHDVLTSAMTSGEPLLDLTGDDLAQNKITYRNHPTWEAARYAAHKAGVTLNYYRLRATWVQARVSLQTSVKHLAHVDGINYQQLDDAMHFLDVPTDNDLRHQLR